MTTLTTAQRTVLLSIKDGSTPPYKGAPLAAIQKKIIEAGYRTESGELTDKGYEALGMRRIVHPDLSVERIPYESEGPAAYEKRITQTKVAKEPMAKSATGSKAPKIARETLKELRDGAVVELPKAAILVEGQGDEALGYYIPYEYEIDDKPMTFYRAFVSGKGYHDAEMVSENCTTPDYAAKRIVQEYNRRHKTSIWRKKP